MLFDSNLVDGFDKVLQKWRAYTKEKE